MLLVSQIENPTNITIPVHGYKKGAWAGYTVLFVDPLKLSLPQVRGIEELGGIVTLATFGQPRLGAKNDNNSTE